MVDGMEEGPPRSGGENRGVGEDVSGAGDAGARARDAAPRIGEDAEPGQTTSEPEPGDVGVPPAGEMNAPA